MPGARGFHSPQYRLLCNRLKKLRTDADMTQRDLAAVLKLPQTYVHKIETGTRRIDPLELIQWCRATGCDPSDTIRQIELSVRR